MTAETDVDAWKRVAEHLGIEIVAPFRMEIGGAHAIFTALFPQFGASQGMVVDADWNVLEPHANALSSAGYGFSCVGISGEREDFQGMKIMFADWGWSSPDPAPSWLPANS